MITYFGHGTSFSDDPFSYLDRAPTIRPPLDLTDTDTDDESEKAGLHASESTSTSTSLLDPMNVLEPREPKVKSKPKAQYMDRMPDIANTKGFFPLDKDSLHNTGIPSTHLVKRTGSSGKGQSIYMCPYESECSVPPYSGDIASTGSHVRCHHLALSLVCPYCGLRFYNATGWKDHMGSKHTDMPHYCTQVGMMAPPSSLPAPLPRESPFELLVSVPTSAPDPEPEPVDTLPFVADAEEDAEEPAPAPPPVTTEIQGPALHSTTPKPTSGIDSYTTADLYHIMAYLPSDLRQFSFFRGGKWVGQHRKDDSQTRLLAAATVSETIESDVPQPESGEEPLIKRRKKEQVHIYPEEHYGQIWRSPGPDNDTDGGTSTA